MTVDDDAPLADLLRLLDIERLEETVFRGGSPETSVQRVFGGQVAGQALVAAGRTVPAERAVHSLHAYFLHAGDPAIPLLYTVDVTRDTRTMSTRRVTALQHGRAIFILTASFMLAESGPRHADAMPAAPDPETLPRMEERLAEVAARFGRGRPTVTRPIDIRYVDEPPILRAVRGESGPPDQQVWIRAAGSLPDDPLLHVCVLTYASDMTLLDAVLSPHRLNFLDGSAFVASLDHAMWFHEPFRADEWLLYDQHSPWAGAARGLAQGRIFDRSGRLVCSVVQEGLVRVRERG